MLPSRIRPTRVLPPIPAGIASVYWFASPYGLLPAETFGMSILSQFERRLEGAIEGAFSKAFRAGLHPAELATRILREMESNKTVGVKGVWVPNRFVFSISPSDAERFHDSEDVLRAELEQVVVDAALERGWILLGPPAVTLEEDDTLRQGL